MYSQIVRIKFTKHDITWVLFLIWSASSSFWGYNGSLVWYFLFGWVGLLVLFKISSSLQKVKTKLYFLLCCTFFVVLAMHYYAIVLDTPFDKSWNIIMSKKMNYTPAYLAMLSMFILYADFEEVIKSRFSVTQTPQDRLIKGVRVVNPIVIVGVSYVLWHNYNRAAIAAYLVALTLYGCRRFKANQLNGGVRFGVITMVLFLSIYSIFPSLLFEFSMVRSIFGEDPIRMSYTIETMRKLAPCWLYGFGLGNWGVEMFSGDISSFSIGNYASAIDYSHNHNFFNQLLGELGAVGFSLFGLFLFIPLYRSSGRYSSLSSKQKAAFSAVLIYVVTSLSYASVNFDLYHFSEINVVLMLSLSMLMPVYGSSSESYLDHRVLFLLMCSLCVIWFVFSKVWYDEYKAIELLPDSEIKSEELQSLYKAEFFNLFKGTPIAFLIGKNAQNQGQIAEAQTWFEIALEDNKASRESLLELARLKLRDLGEIEQSKDLALRYYNIDNINFDINLLLLEISIYDKDFMNERQYRDAVIHSKYSLRKAILEYCLFNNIYRSKLLDGDSEGGSLSSNETMLLSYLPELERENISVELKDDVQIKLGFLIEEQEGLLFNGLDSIEFYTYIEDRFRAGLNFRINYDLNKLNTSEDERELLFPILMAYKIDTRINQITRRELLTTKGLGPCEKLKLNMVRDSLSQRNIDLLKQLEPSCFR